MDFINRRLRHYVNGYLSSDKESGIAIDSQRASTYCVKSYPLLANLGFESNDEMFWTKVHLFVVEMCNDPSIIFPPNDFSLFLQQIENYKELLNPQCLDTCIVYASKFCPTVVGNFYFLDYLKAISDPITCLFAMKEMNSISFPSWTSFIKQHGMIERFFDLFITFLQPFDSTDDEKLSHFAILLADLMVSLIIENEDLIVLSKELVSGFYSRLLNLIKYSCPSVSISFTRSIIRLNNIWLPKLSEVEQFSHISSLLSSSPIGRASHSIIAHYIVSLCGKCISHRAAVSLFTKMSCPSIFDLESLFIISSSAPKETKLVCVRYLCQVMCQKKFLTKLAASLLIDMLKSNTNNHQISNWVKVFIRRLFMFFRICVKREKYLKRVHILCDLLSSGFFSSISYIQEEIIKSANEAYSKQKGFVFITDYFPISEKKVPNSDFGQELSKFETSRCKLKAFPFKMGSNQLYDPSRTSIKPKVDLPRDPTIDEFLREEGLEENELRFVYYDPNASGLDQQECIFNLEDFIEQEQEKLDKIMVDVKYINKLDPYAFRPDGAMMILGIRQFIEENEISITEYRKSSLQRFINVARTIVSSIKQQSYILADLKMLTVALNSGVIDDPQYKNMKKKRVTLKKAARVIARSYAKPNYGLDLQIALSNEQRQFDSENQYMPPSLLDIYTSEFLYRKQFFGIVKAASQYINDKVVDVATSSIWELNASLNEILGSRVSFAISILHSCIIRFLFDLTYYSYPQSILNSYQAQDIEFVKKCGKFSQQPLVILGIPSDLFKTQKDLTISQFFMNRPLGFSNLEFMTNPIDIIYNIHKTLNSFSSVLNNKSLNTNYIQKLTVGLLACNPPSNPVSIKAFLEIWGNLMISIDAQKSKVMFIGSIEYIMPEMGTIANV